MLLSLAIAGAFTSVFQPLSALPPAETEACGSAAGGGVTDLTGAGSEVIG